jgi:hypothetical protein
VFFALVLGLASPCFSDGPRPYDGFFVEGSFHHYFAPGELNGLLEPLPGFRAALGYDYRRFRFAVESGYSHIKGTNPLVLDITLAPFALKFGYELPVVFGFGVQADLHAGYFFSRTVHYETAIDMLTGNLRDDGERNLFAGLRTYLTWTTKNSFFKIYAGGGADVVFETGGPIPLPLLEAGISIKPFTLIRPRAARPAAAQPVTERSFGAVYFEANSTAIIERYLSALDEAGRLMQENPSLQITLRTYTAPKGDVEWQVQRSGGTPALSAARAEWCAEYLVRNYGVDLSRIRIEYIDALDETQRESYRCVELITRG